MMEGENGARYKRGLSSLAVRTILAPCEDGANKKALRKNLECFFVVSMERGRSRYRPRGCSAGCATPQGRGP